MELGELGSEDVDSEAEICDSGLEVGVDDEEIFVGMV